MLKEIMAEQNSSHIVSGLNKSAPYNEMAVFNITDRNSSHNEDDYEFDYYNIEHRFNWMLERPHDLIAIILGVTSILLNMIVLTSLYQLRSRITAHFRLIISLAVSDILVGTSVLLHIINRVVNPNYEPGNGPYTQRLVSRCSFLAIKALNTTGLNITLFNLMLMAIDHYIAIMKPLQYPIIMRRKRIVAVIVAAWILAFILGYSDFLSAVKEYSWWEPYGFNYCEVVWITLYQEEYTTFVFAPVCLGIMIYIYIRIYIKVHQHRRPGVGDTTLGRGKQRTTKALVTTLLTLGTFVIAWLPQSLFQISCTIRAFQDPEGMAHIQHKLHLVDRYLYNLLILNAIADPIIYTVRMREVQIGFLRLYCSCMPGVKLESASRRSSATSARSFNQSQRKAQISLLDITNRETK